jgi:asparagine synthase (glutamine-hydrolysing)
MNPEIVSDQILISRDCFGTKPLYFAENNEFCAFASNKKPLWKIGLGEVSPLKAGTMAIFNGKGISVKKASSHRKKGNEIKDMPQAVDKYDRALYVTGHPKAATCGRVKCRHW